MKTVPVRNRRVNELYPNRTASNGICPIRRTAKIVPRQGSQGRLQFPGTNAGAEALSEPEIAAADSASCAFESSAVH